MAAPTFHSTLNSGGRAAAGATGAFTLSALPVAASLPALVAMPVIEDGGTAGRTILGVVWDPAGSNLSFTQLGAAALAAGFGETTRADIWGLLNPPTGAKKKVVVTYSAAPKSDFLSIHQYDGVDSFGNSINDQSNSGGAAVAISLTTSRENSVILMNAAVSIETSSPFTPAGGITERADGRTGLSAFNDCGFTADELTVSSSASTVTISTTNTGVTEWWAACGAELRSPAAGGAVGAGLVASILLDKRGLVG